MKKNITVIGGGAGGLFAAGRAAELGGSVTLLEKNGRLGKKLSITGKGRCNVTNAVSADEIIAGICGNPRFMYSAIAAFDSSDTARFFENEGVKLKVERGNRVFPVSDDAGEIVSCLEKYAARNNVKILLNTPALDILTSGGRVSGVLTQNGTIAADAVILATGGLSYPGTGSTGDGYAFAKKLGHTVTPLYPSLAPLVASESWVSDLQGLSLRNVGITAFDGKNAPYRDFGELLFTHYGLSGPVILSASRYLLGSYDKNRVIKIDLKPALTEEQLDKRLLRDFEKFSLKAFKNSLSELLPKKMIPVIVGLSGIDPDKTVSELSRIERKTLVALLKGLTVTVKGSRGFNEAIITAGGVRVDEINPKTMESKIVPGLFFCGELIDVDAYTGGFNLQIAFSTGRAAGKGAAMI